MGQGALERESFAEAVILETIADTEQALLLQNGRTANAYAVRCLLYSLAAILALWLLQVLGIYQIPAALMDLGAASAAVVLLIPAVLQRFFPERTRLVRAFTFVCALLEVFILSSMLPKHLILAWAIPLVLSCHYYDRLLTLRVLAASCVLLIVSGYVGMLYGEWDQALLGWSVEQAAALVYPGLSYPELLARAPEVQGSLALRREVIRQIGGLGGSRYLSVFAFYLLPRCMLLVALTPICTSLVSRSKAMIAQQRAIYSKMAIAEYRSTHDFLTGLYNRNKYETMLAGGGYDGLGSCGVLYFDVNGLKQTNDSAGHKAGDALICRAAASLQPLTGAACDGYRLGGDEFLLVLPGCSRRELRQTKAAWAETLRRLNADGAQEPCRMAVGAAFAQGRVSVPELVQQADREMYENKRAWQAAGRTAARGL